MTDEHQTPLNTSTITTANASSNYQSASSDEKSIAPSAAQTGLPTSALLIPAGDSSGGSAIATPLRKALHAAAALASVTAGNAALGANFPVTIDAANATPSTNEEDPKLNKSNATPLATVAEDDATASSKKRKSTKVTFQGKSARHPLPPIAPLMLPHAVPTGMHMPYGYLAGHSLSLPPSVLGAPGGYHQMQAAIQASEVPHIFRDRPQRSGKWTREEECYADLLIELFEKGHIDEKNGSTLRSFLSRKLHCAPMRISKKYAGKGIGKMVFLSKNSFRGTGDAIGSPAYHNNMQRLRHVEAEFYKSCFPEIAMQLVPGQGIPIPPPLPNMMNHHPIAPAVPPAPTGFLPVLAPGAFLVPLPPHGGPPPTGNSSSWTPPPPAAPPPALMPTVQPQPDAPPPVPKPVSARESLEQAYLRVTQQEFTPAPTSIAPVGQLAAQNISDRHVESLRQQYHTPPPEAANPPATGNGNEPLGTDSTNTRSKRMGPASDAALPKGLPKANDSAPTEIPDFLSGFDKVAGQCNPSPLETMPAYDPSQYSPSRFTTGSFDDFHRLLGTNLTPDIKKRLSVPFHQGPDVEVNSNALSAPRDIPSIQAPDYQKQSQRASFQAFAPSTRSPGQFLLDHGAPASAPELDAPFPPGPRIPPRQSPTNQQEMLDRAFCEAMAAASRSAGTPAHNHHVADSYNIFAQQSAIAASQHSAYMGPRGQNGGGEDGLLVMMGGQIETMMAGNLAQAWYPSFSRPPASSFPMAGVVSEPSHTSSELGSDEVPGSGTESKQNPSDSSSNDSDGTNSESSRKKVRMATTFHQYGDLPVGHDQRQQMHNNRYYGEGS